MPKVKDLLEVQVGRETSRGTSVTPTAILMGVTEFTAQPHEESIVHAEMRGDLQPGYNASEIRRWAEGHIVMDVSYEDICYLLCGLFDDVATATGTSAPYTWTFNAPTAAVTPRSQTFVFGDGTDDYGLWGALVSNLTIRGESGGPLVAEADLLGTQVDEDDQASLSFRTVNMALGHHLSLYIDAADGTIGTTSISNTMFSFELNINPNRANVYHAGSLGPTGYRDMKWSGTLKLLVELTTGTSSSDVQSFLEDMLDSAPLEKQIRIKADNGSNETLTINFAGRTLDVPQLFSDNDGVVCIEPEFTGVYNSQLGNWLQIVVENGNSTLA